MPALPPHTVTVAAVALALIAPFAVFFGVNLTGDDVLYGRLAADMAFDQPVFFHNPHPARLGFIAPVALFYKIFGVQAWTTIALTVVSTVLSVLVCAGAAHRLYGSAAAGWAALFCGFHPILYRYGTMGLADVPAGVGYGLFAVGWILVATHRVSRRRLTAFLAGAVGAWAMAIRESTAPMVLLTLGAFMVYGWRRSEMKEFPLLAFLGGGCLVGLPYLFTLWYYTGSPFYGVHAAQISYNLQGAPWLEPLEGARFWFRLFGFSLLRSAVEGYLIVLAPLLIMAVCAGKMTIKDRSAATNLYLFMAAFSPLLILSHFPTTFEHWNPVRLDLRFGSPVVIPGCILAAGACMRLPPLGSGVASRSALAGFLLAVAVIFFVGVYRENCWTMVGAAAALVVAATQRVCVRLSSNKLLPAVVSILLVGFWAHYALREFPHDSKVNRQLWGEAAAALVAPRMPILTDHITAQYVPLLSEYSQAPKIVTWEMQLSPAGTTGPATWAEQFRGPLAGAYKILWYPQTAAIRAGRWGGTVPSWVLDELRRATRLVSFQTDPEMSAEPSAAVLQTAVPPDWPQPGLYRVGPPAPR